MPERNSQIAMTLTTTYAAEESAVFAHVRQRRGRDHAITRAALVTATGLNDRAVRAAIASLIQIHGCPIGSSPRGGYYWIVAPDELQAEAAKLVHYGTAIFRRLRALVGSRRARELLGQTGLFGNRHR
ncbi:MAG: hypothetical protein P9L99_13410 [Candidatus Lernaella stagnicola]|nr:hypothetical protein [Candidatus Lernaella stagnicola]